MEVLKGVNGAMPDKVISLLIMICNVMNLSDFQFTMFLPVGYNAGIVAYLIFINFAFW